MPLQYLFPFKAVVEKEYLKLKYYCNFFLMLTVAALLLNIVLGLLIFNLNY